MGATNESVGVRELRQNLSVYLRKVKEGARLEVTEHGRPVAVLAPCEPRLSRLQQMIRDGLAQPAREPWETLGPPLRLSKAKAAAIKRALEEQKEDTI